MVIFNWLTEETAQILLNFIDDHYEVESRYGSINNSQMKTISFIKDGSHFTIVIDKTGIKHSPELFELELEAFVLQEIRNEKLQDLLKFNSK